jgi:hypothetical protein
MKLYIMENTNKDTRERPWINLIGMILLLLGVYGLVRTSINSTMFDKYPIAGMYPNIPIIISLGNYAIPSDGTPYIGNERDCIYSSIYYTEDGNTPRKPTPEEKEYDET